MYLTLSLVSARITVLTSMFISFTMVPDLSVDILITGAGPAGASLAAFMGQNGRAYALL